MRLGIALVRGGGVINAADRRLVTPQLDETDRALAADMMVHFEAMAAFKLS